MNDASARMQGLMTDLIDYTSILQTNAEDQPVDLNNTINKVLEIINSKILNTKAIITVGTLPQIIGEQKQLNLLFYNLIDNSL